MLKRCVHLLLYDSSGVEIDRLPLAGFKREVVSYIKKAPTMFDSYNKNRQLSRVFLISSAYRTCKTMTHEMTDQQTAISLANDGGNEAELTDQKVQSHGWVRTEEQGKETFSIIVSNDGSSSSANLQVMLAATIIDNGCLKITKYKSSLVLRR